MTLIEVMVVIFIVALLTGAMVMGSGSLASAQMRKAAATITGGVRVAYTRATATSKVVRMVFDIDQGSVWLEEGSPAMLVQARDKTGTGGADPATDAERAAIAEGERILKGPRPARPSFRPIKDLGFEDVETGKGVKQLGKKIKFRSVQAGHDDAPRTSGRAYLYFWPGGQTERASIQLRVGDSTEDADTLTLLVAPLTGRVTSQRGSVDMPEPRDDREASDREDTGF
jgi:general secretion pathway protein H